MSKDALRFEEIGVLRTRGFELHGFTVGGLSAGINVIYGPNGSGKTTTARALEQLLWPRLATGERVSLAGRFHLGGAEWAVEVDGGRVAYRCAGSPTSAPLLPPMEDHHRYRLSLHDLLYERDTSFARAIVRETAGGYDVAGAGAALPQRANRLASKQAALEDARAQLDAAVAAQRELRDQELQLTELRLQKEAADEAQRNVTVLEAALEHAAAREQEAQARWQLEQFPAGMGKLGGNEHERLCQLRERIRTAGEKLKQAVDARESALAVIERTQIPDSAAGAEVLDALEADVQALKRAENEAAATERTRRDAAVRLGKEGARIGGAVDDSRLASLDHIGMASLADFVRRAEALKAAGDALAAELRLLGDPHPVEEEARLADGIGMLQRWLRQPEPASPPARHDGASTAGLIAAGLLVALGIGLGVALHLLYLAVALVGAGLLWSLLRPRRPAAVGAPDPRAVYRGEYTKLGLAEPQVWEPEAVERVLEALQGRWVAARVGADRERRRGELEALRAEHAIGRQALEAERAGVAERLGVEPSIDPPSLAWLAERISGWQAAHAEWSGADQAHGMAVARAEALAARLRERLEPLGFLALATVGDIEGAIRAFRQRRQECELARERLQTAKKEEQRLAEECSRTEEELQALFAALDLDPDRDDTVRDWCDRHADYVRAHDAHREAGNTLRHALARLVAHGGAETLTTTPRAELEARLLAESERASVRDELTARISGIDALVGQAKESHSIEKALEQVDRAEEVLRQARDQDSRAAIARELLAYVEAATRDQLLPNVFFRAREIFTRITHGRYELRLLREGEAAFAAYDNQERRERTLGELSSGSRVQLLIAVRIAFVEQQEQGLMLPLVLDEVLGNSDDARARAIMDAALELAREGRQIFYFTAQADEVARWRLMLGEGEPGVELCEIDLLRLRGKQRALEIPAIAPAEPRTPPAPAGVDHAEYGRRIGVPRLDRATLEPASVHLWYLVEDTEVLYRLLRLGPERWGTLEAFARDGGRTLVDAGLFAELSACARALQAFAEAARVGVGLPVDRAVLEDSEAVTEIYRERVVELARESGGDGRILVEELADGAVPGFRKKALQKLRDYLEDHGYIDHEVPLDPAGVRARILPSAIPDIDSGRLSVDRLDRLLGRLWMGMGEP